MGATPSIGLPDLALPDNRGRQSRFSPPGAFITLDLLRADDARIVQKTQ